MKLYADCSDDIKKTARMIVDSYGSHGALLEGAIAAALDSEREASADVAETADTHLLHDDRLEDLTRAEFNALFERDARIAAAIRNRGKP